MGRVYLGEHVLMRKRVAIKFMHRELTAVPEIVQRFEREALAAAHIEHPHVASCTDFGRLEDGTVYLILEYVEGQSLSDLIAQGPLNAKRALGIASQIASALEAAHARDIVHRDLKPDNILLVQRDSRADFIKVLDFGIARVPVKAGSSAGPITQVGMVYGTPEYMAPEQALGQTVDHRADLYALGVIVYEMLTGLRPYGGSVTTLLGQQLSQPFPSMRERAGFEVPPEAEALTGELLTVDVDRRLGTATEAVEKLEEVRRILAHRFPERDSAQHKLPSRLGRQRDVSEQRGDQGAQGGRRVGRGRGYLMALVFGLIGVATGVIGIGYWKGREPTSQPSAQVPSEPESASEVESTSPADSEEAFLPGDSPEDLSRDIEVAQDKGVEALRFLAEKHPAEARVHAVLALELAREGLHEEAVIAVRKALELDPQLNESPEIRDALLRAAQSSQASSAALRLLQGPMGSAGADIIYDLSKIPEVNAWVKSQAHEFLSSEDARDSASPQLRLLLDFSETKNCEEVLELVSKAETIGDHRVLPLLRKMRTKTGCGRNDRDDCYPCLRGSEVLPSAISAVEKRTEASSD